MTPALGISVGVCLSAGLLAVQAGLCLDVSVAGQPHRGGTTGGAGHVAAGSDR